MLKNTAVSILVILTIFPLPLAIAGPQQALKKGYVQNDQGQKCTFTQTFENNVIHFTEKHIQDIGTIIFDDAGCMSDSELGSDTNKMMVNNLISKWYSQSDANFKTHPSEMFPTSMLQIKGECIQSSTYHNSGIAVEYSIANDSIAKVIHGSAIGRCQAD